MAENVQQSVEVPVGLALFSSLDTEMSPSDLPEGVSPDNQDIIFLPGSVASRPCLNRIYSTLPAGTTVTYFKSFVMPNGSTLNIILCSNGSLFTENTSVPGVLTQIGGVTPGSYCNSTTAFGREYLCFHNGVSGTDIPRQFDGTYLDRVTQGGPGAPPSVSSLIISSSQMASAGNTLTRNNNTVTARTQTAHGLDVGYQAQISNVPDSNSTSVMQSGNSSVQSTEGTGSTYWSLNSGQWRSNFNPGTSPLSAFVAKGIGLTIPSNATILGVVAIFGAVSQAITVGTVSQVALWYSGAQLGVVKDPATPITTTITNTPYGSAGDLWSAALTPAIVNDPSFGVAISCACDSTRVFLCFPFTIQVYYTLSSSGAVSQIQSIVIDNETNPGQALITTTTPHGLVPQINVSIVGVEPGVISDIASAQWSAGTTTLTTVDNHGLTPGSVIQVAGVTTSTSDTDFSFDGTFVIDSVPAPNQISYTQVPITATDPDVINASSGGNVTVAWPIPTDTPTPTYFEVQSCPTPTTFYVAVNYSNATWTTGTVGFIWEGIFYVTAVLNPTSFQYQQYGPNAATTAIGTVTPFGQAAPGIRSAVVLFQTRQGAILTPSPPLNMLVTNGGQYIFVSNIPIGPPNVVARIIAFTGADGGNFFYIPVPAIINGIQVSTSTVINDNTTTSAVLDFSDNTLFNSLAIDINGNNLFNQQVLGPCLGVANYSSRNAYWGFPNALPNLLNMGFEGGYLAGVLTTPLGWEVVTPGGALQSATVDYGLAWAITGDGTSNAKGQISQSAFEDYEGIAILQPSTQYSFRFWGILNSPGTPTGNIICDLYSPTDGVLASAEVVASSLSLTSGSFFSADFSAETPVVIPSDTVLRVYAQDLPNNFQVILDELEIIPTADPVGLEFLISYPENPEALDGVTGLLGATNDNTPIQSTFQYRDAFLFLTKQGLHETLSNSNSEPSGWEVQSVENSCGTASPRSVTTGVNFSAWVSDPVTYPATGRGVYVYTGGGVYKISQEIQPAFDSIVAEASSSIWAKDDSINRRLCFGLPVDGATAPNMIYVLDYRELATQGIINNPPIHISLTGKMVCSDLTRKWTRWNVNANYADMYQVPGSGVQFCIAGGNGLVPNTSPGYNNVYWFNPDKYTDDDYGQIVPYYITYFFVNHEAEQTLQVGLHRKLFKRYAASVTGIGQFKLTPYANNLSNPWPSPPMWPLPQNSDYDIGDGLNISTERCAFKVESVPYNGQTDNAFNLTKFIITLMQEPVSPLRYGAI